MVQEVRDNNIVGSMNEIECHLPNLIQLNFRGVIFIEAILFIISVC